MKNDAKKNKRSVFSDCVSFNKMQIKPCLFLPVFFVVPFVLFANFSFAQQTNELVKEGNDAYRKNDFTPAIQDYTKALVLDKNNAIARFNMGNAMQKSNNLQAAADAYDNVISSSTDEALQSKAYYNKGLNMLQQKKIEAAIDAFKQSLRLAPSDNDTRENLQKALSEKQQQPPPPPQPQKQQQNNPPQNQPQMNKKMMEQKFKMLQDQEKQLQSNLQKQKENTRDQREDW